MNMLRTHCLCRVTALLKRMSEPSLKPCVALIRGWFYAEQYPIHNPNPTLYLVHVQDAEQAAGAQEDAVPRVRLVRRVG